MTKIGSIIYGNDGLEKSVQAVRIAEGISDDILFIEENNIFSWTMLKGCNYNVDTIIIDPITTVEAMHRAFSMSAVGKLWVEPIIDGGHYIEPYFIFVLDEEISSQSNIIEGFGASVRCRFDLIECNL